MQDKQSNENKNKKLANKPDATQDNKDNNKSDDGRFVSMQGVSGKVITGTIKVKKARDKGDIKENVVKPSANQSENTNDEKAINSNINEDRVISSAKVKSKDNQAVNNAMNLTKNLGTPVKKPRKIGNINENKDNRMTSDNRSGAEQVDDVKANVKKSRSTLKDVNNVNVDIKKSTQVQPRKIKSGTDPETQNKSNVAFNPESAVTKTTSRDFSKDVDNKPKGPRKIASGDAINNVGPRKLSSGNTGSLAATAQAYTNRKTQKDNKRQSQEFDSKNNKRRGEKRNSFEPSPFDKDTEEEPRFRSQPRKRKKNNDVEVDITMSKNQDAKNKFTRNKTRSRSFETTKQDRRMERELEFTRHQSKVRKKKETPSMTASSPVSHVALLDTMTVKEFAEAISRTSADVIMHLMQNGVMATLNDNIDYETATIIAEEFDITTERLEDNSKIETDLFDEGEDVTGNLVERPPVVVVMGHVDHGKTTLLDNIRSSKVAGGEAGGITQKIGAYMVDVNGRKITFLDTPGHEAFTTMRARGAKATDIAILVVAADDGIMPQTIEAINHAKAAKTQIIVAINKMDKPDANPNKVLEQLTQYDLVPEDWGGSTVVVPISALTGDGVDELLEMVLLTADILELQVDPNRQSKGIIIEARLDKHRGVVATALVQRGTLKQGDTILVDTVVGNVRAMKDSIGDDISLAGPSVPVEILGLPEVPEVGSSFYVVEDERKAKEYAAQKASDEREEGFRKAQVITLDNLFSHIEAGQVMDFNVIIKADVVGSVEAMKQELEKLSNNEIRVNVIHGAAGAINESDVRLAEASNAIIIGFNVRPSNSVHDLASDLGVELRLYSIIYKAIEDVDAAMKGRLAPEFEEVILGHVEIRETYKVSSIGTIGGGYVTDGKITRNSKCRLIRNGIVVYDGEINSLRRFQDDVKEVNTGYECGLTISNYNDLKVDDIVETYTMREVERI